MTISLIRCAIVCAGVAALVLPAGAQQIMQVEVVNPPARFQLVGFTTPTYDGDLGGPLGANQKCQDEGFGGSRMCTTPEVFSTVDIPIGLFGTAWVRPIPAGNGDTDVSGFGSIESCNFWVSSGGDRGLAVTAGGSPSRPFCNVMRSIACCALVP